MLDALAMCRPKAGQSGVITQLTPSTSFGTVQTPAGVLIGDWMYIAGTGTTYTDLYRYNVQTNVLQYVTNLPFNAADFAMATVGVMIYFCWGVNGGSQRLFHRAFNTSTSQWTTLADQPITGTFGFATPYPNGFAVMGQSAGYYQAIYNTTSNTWANTTLASPSPGYFLGGYAVTNSDATYLYAGGGTTNGNKLWRQDTATKLWSALANAPVTLSYTSNAAMHKGKLYVYGGTVDGTAFTKRLFSYDPAADKWSEYLVTSPAGMAATKRSVLISNGTNMFIFGGQISGGTYNSVLSKLVV